MNFLPLSLSNSYPVEFSEPKAKPKGMTILFAIYSIFCANSAVFIVRSLPVAEWTSQDITSVIGACSALFAALVAGFIAIINALTKAKIEEHKSITEQNSAKLGEIHTEMVKNTTAVDQEKVRVEELTREIKKDTKNE